MLRKREDENWDPQHLRVKAGMAGYMLPCTHKAECVSRELVGLAGCQPTARLEAASGVQ